MKRILAVAACLLMITFCGKNESSQKKSRKYHPAAYERYYLLEFKYANPETAAILEEVVREIDKEFQGKKYLFCGFQRFSHSWNNPIPETNTAYIKQSIGDCKYKRELGVYYFDNYHNPTRLKNLTLYIPRDYLQKIRISVDLINGNIRKERFTYIFPVMKPIYQEYKEPYKWRRVGNMGLDNMKPIKSNDKTQWKKDLKRDIFIAIFK